MFSQVIYFKNIEKKNRIDYTTLVYYERDKIVLYPFKNTYRLLHSAYRWDQSCTYLWREEIKKVWSPRSSFSRKNVAIWILHVWIHIWMSIFKYEIEERENNILVTYIDVKNTNNKTRTVFNLQTQNLSNIVKCTYNTFYVVSVRWVLGKKMNELGSNKTYF